MAGRSSKFLSDHKYYFHKGESCRAYDFLGAHFSKVKGVRGVIFRVWAPNAEKVSVVGDFNGWNRDTHIMECDDGGIFEVFVPDLGRYDSYKYCVTGADGASYYKSDPYATHTETRPNTASKVFDIDGYRWHDGEWLERRRAANHYKSPMNVYEVHLGGWIKNADGGFLSDGELADKLSDYVTEMGYTHVELMPVMEHPLDNSWGYQTTGYFAPTSRYGTPHDFMYFIDKLHQRGIGVILDWVPAHFPKDRCGLYEFDGTCLYEYADPLKREHPDWGTRIFDYGRPEVVSFLQSSAMLWIEKYHADGLRIDAVASMLYLDYGKKDGEWRQNQYGGNENIEAIAFVRSLNHVLLSEHPDVITFAEESTAWPMVTKPDYLGGLGFNYKWNMGWMNDSLSYMETDPIYRQYHHDKLTFPVMYAFSENYILPISHDEVVHLKKSLIGKMPGYYKEKFENLKTFLAYMTAFPGKKLLFMGCEIAQMDEWNEDLGVQFTLLSYPAHDDIKRYVKQLNAFYRVTPALWQKDCEGDGFYWICADDKQQNTISFVRRDDKGKFVIFVANFSPVGHFNYRIGVPTSGAYRQVFSSDFSEFGGEDTGRRHRIIAEKSPSHGFDWSVEIDIPPLAAVFYEIDGTAGK